MKNHFALTFAIFISFVKCIWILMIGIFGTSFENFLNWVAKIHSLQTSFHILPLNFADNFLMIILTFVISYFVGTLISIIWKKTRF